MQNDSIPVIQDAYEDPVVTRMLRDEREVNAQVYTPDMWRFGQFFFVYAQSGNSTLLAALMARPKQKWYQHRITPLDGPEPTPVETNRLWVDFRERLTGVLPKKLVDQVREPLGAAGYSDGAPQPEAPDVKNAPHTGSTTNMPIGTGVKFERRVADKKSDEVSFVYNCGIEELYRKIYTALENKPISATEIEDITSGSLQLDRHIRSDLHIVASGKKRRLANSGSWAVQIYSSSHKDGKCDARLVALAGSVWDRLGAAFSDKDFVEKAKAMREI
ncbi:MAG: hypothetical protein LBL35_05115 [Clostridiales bacterium]|nr:hypothetical protein [Clostridiales bacterium]